MPGAKRRLVATTTPKVIDHSSDETVPQPPADRARRTIGSRLEACESGLIQVFRVIAIAAAIAELVIILIDIIGSNVSGYYLSSTEDSGRLAVLTVGLFGAAVAAFENEHMALSPIGASWPRWSQLALAVRLAAVGGFCLLECVEGVRQSSTDWPQTAGSLNVTATVMDLPLVIGFAMITLITLTRLGRLPWKYLISAAIIAAIPIGLCVMARSASLFEPGVASVLVVVVAMAALALMGTPLAVVLGLGSVVFVYLTGVTFQISVFTSVQSGISNFILLSVPFFIATGLIMSEGGLSDRLSEFLNLLVRRIRGGLWDVMIGSMFVFSGISGSKVADTAAVGASMEPMLTRMKYPRSESAAILAAAAAAGETIPPSIAMIVLGTVTSVSVSALFAAGILPALFISIGLALVVHIRNRRRSIAGDTSARPNVLRTTIAAIPAFCVPVVLVGGIVLGIGTPTEVAGASTILALLISWLLYRKLSWSVGRQILKRLVSLNGAVLLLVGGAAAFGYIMSIAQIPDRVASSFSGLAGGKAVFLLASVIVLVVFGAVLEGMPAILIFGPILIPSAMDIGLNPVQFGITFLVALGAGTSLPPIGVVINVACKLFETKIEATFRAMSVYTVWLVACAVVIGLVPWLSLALPRAFHLTTS